MNLRIKKQKRNLRRNRTFRASDNEYNSIEQKALVHCDGNVSEWIRFASLNCSPRKTDLEPDGK